MEANFAITLKHNSETNLINFFHDGGPYYIETSSLIWRKSEKHFKCILYEK